MIKRIVFSLILTLGLTACELTRSIVPIETPTLLPTVPPTPTVVEPSPAPGEVTQAPVLEIPTQVPLPTVAPAGTESACRPGEVLAGIRKDFPYEVAGKKALYATDYFFYQDLRAIVVWFQDESLDTNEVKTGVKKAAEDARTHASQVIADLLKRDECIQQLFTTLDVTVVDGADNGWFSAELALDKLPSPIEVQGVGDAFESVYLREKLPDPAKEKSDCTFGEARTRIKRHFSDGKQLNANLDFYMVVDEGLGTLYAQWTGDASLTNNLARVLNVASELQCLTVPKVDSIFFTVVDKKGEMLAAGKMPGESIATLDVTKIEYQTVQ